MQKHPRPRKSWGCGRWRQNNVKQLPIWHTHHKCLLTRNVGNTTLWTEDWKMQRIYPLDWLRSGTHRIPLASSLSVKLFHLSPYLENFDLDIQQFAGIVFQAITKVWIPQDLPSWPTNAVHEDWSLLQRVGPLALPKYLSIIPVCMLQLEAVTPAGRSQVHRTSTRWTRDQVWCRLGQRQNLVLPGPQFIENPR